MPKSHQEENAKLFREKNAAVVLDEEGLDKYKLVIEIENLLNDENKMNSLAENISKMTKNNPTEEFVGIIEKITN